MKILSLSLATVIGAFCASCDDRDFASLTPMKEIAAFEVKASLADTDATLERVAERHGLTVNRDPKPRERPIPRDYLATVLDRDCMLIVEGTRLTGTVTMNASLEVAEGSKCDARMHQLFVDFRGSFRQPPRA